MASTVRTRPGTARQAVRLARTEFTLMHRYRTALFLMVTPLVFTLLGLAQQGVALPSGLDAGAMLVAGSMVVAPVFIGLVHASNIYTARREQLVLKRFRASGVPAAALFGGTLLSVFAVVAVLTAISAAVLGARFSLLPADPLMVLVSVAVTTATMTLLGIAMTRLTRSAEGAQLISMVPFLLLFVSSGQAFPLDVLPTGLGLAAFLLPMAPATMLVQSGVTGRTLFFGAESAAPAGGLDLWLAAAPSLGVLLAWLAVAVLLLRSFRWDPRQAA